MFWMGNNENNFLIRTLVKRHELPVIVNLHKCVYTVLLGQNDFINDCLEGHCHFLAPLPYDVLFHFAS